MDTSTFNNLTIAYFNKYNMSYDLIASFIRLEMNVTNLTLCHFDNPARLLKAVEENKIDIIIINSTCLFDGAFREAEVRKVMTALCESQQIITVFIAQDMNATLLKKVASTGVDIMLSSMDKPQELINALMSVMSTPRPETYISPTIWSHCQSDNNDLTAKEWEVINLIQQGYSLSEIASIKCRAMSTVSTQKRNAMNKLHLRTESELLRFLHQSTFFNS